MPLTKKINAAVQIAIISSIIGPLFLLLFKFILEPSTINQSKEEVKSEISIIAISDSLIRERYNDAVVLVKNTQNKFATGFLLAPSYIITSTNILKKNNSDSLIVIRDINNPSGLFEKKYKITYLDSLNKIIVIKTDSEFSNAIQLTESEIKPWDKIFAVGYISWEKLAIVREGRIISNNYKLKNSMVNIYMGDIGIIPGMTGAPVFNKNGNLIGMVRDAQIEWEIAYIVPIRKIQLILENE